MAKNKKRRSPIFGIILLAIGILWMLKDLNIFVSDIWIPSVIIILAIWIIINRTLDKD
jgi:hypothetical protein